MAAALDTDCDRLHVSLFASNLDDAVDFYIRRLGFTLGFTWGDPPTMAGVTLGDVQIFLTLGTPGPDGCAVYFVVSDADEMHEFVAANGVEVVVPPADREYGIRDFTIRDLNGYHLTFGHNIFNVGEPIEIERVAVPVRLERRLAALLADLAEHKRMTVSECLEEILLHTCEPLGDGVASPHTRRTLRHIQTLKEKHGIDYDSHGSYRFIEKT